MFFRIVVAFVAILYSTSITPFFSAFDLHAASKSKISLKAYTFGKNQKFKVGFDGRDIIVQILPRPGEGMYRFGSWTLRDYKNNYKKIKQFNNNRDLQKGQYVQIPFSALNDSLQGLVLQTLFPNDSSEEKGWAHRVVYPGETMSLIAGVFTRKGISAQKILDHNGIKKETHLLIGDVVNIPWEWMREELNLRPIEVKPPLVVKTDQTGKRFAYYKIKKGESLYSSVVIRFTGRTLAEDVNKLANELLRLNRIKDEHFIYVGAEIKIPLEWISEDYIVGKAIAPSVPEPEEKVEPVPTDKRYPIHVIIDPGHGGRDPGAIYYPKNRSERIFEDETVYDIGLRLANMLEKQKYQVHMTLQDPNQKTPVNKLSTRKDEDERILVNPPYILRSANTGINMRIYLVNDIYNRLIKKKVPKRNIVLLSLHGDALHKSLRGATVYFPDARLRKEIFNLSHKIYRKRKEFRRRLRYPVRSNSQAAIISKNFGKKVIQSFKNAGLKTHRSFAVRGYYYRKGERTLPGILRYSQIPTSVLVEVGNLNNVHDRANLRRASYRESIASALADSINSQFNKG